MVPPPILAVPTTSGTGSEVTMWGTVWDEDSVDKHSISHPSLYPEASFMDPTLSLSCPHELTISCGLDAMSHSMESIWNRAANPVAMSYAKHSIQLVVRNLETSLRN